MTTPSKAQIEAAAKAMMFPTIAKPSGYWLNKAEAALTAAAQVGEPRIKMPATVEELDAILNSKEPNVNIQNCPKCGGMHFGSHECPVEIEKERTNATIERCAQVAEWAGYATVGRQIAAAIRKLKDEP